MNKTIYSTDADALEKLEARLEEQEKKYAEMKKLNKYFRENCTVKGYPGIDDEKAAKIDERISNAYSWCKAPYPQYEMQSMSQKIRATKERIKSLETEQTREETEYDTDGLGFDVVENKEIARLQIIYPGGGRVDNETYKRLRENGFVFSRTNGAFQRQLNENSRYAVRRFIQSQRNIVEQMSTKKETEAEMGWNGKTLQSMIAFAPCTKLRQTGQSRMKERCASFRLKILRKNIVGLSISCFV